MNMCLVGCAVLFFMGNQSYGLSEDVSGSHSLEKNEQCDGNTEIVTFDDFGQKIKILMGKCYNTKQDIAWEDNPCRDAYQWIFRAACRVAQDVEYLPLSKVDEKSSMEMKLALEWTQQETDGDRLPLPSTSETLRMMHQLGSYLSPFLEAAINMSNAAAINTSNEANATLPKEEVQRRRLAALDKFAMMLCLKK